MPWQPTSGGLGRSRTLTVSCRIRTSSAALLTSSHSKDSSSVPTMYTMLQQHGNTDSAASHDHSKERHISVALWIQPRRTSSRAMASEWNEKLKVDAWLCEGYIRVLLCTSARQ